MNTDEIMISIANQIKYEFDKKEFKIEKSYFGDWIENIIIDINEAIQIRLSSDYKEISILVFFTQDDKQGYSSIRCDTIEQFDIYDVAKYIDMIRDEGFENQFLFDDVYNV